MPASLVVLGSSRGAVSPDHSSAVRVVVADGLALSKRVNGFAASSLPKLGVLTWCSTLVAVDGKFATARTGWRVLE